MLKTTAQGIPLHKCHGDDRCPKCRTVFILHVDAGPGVFLEGAKVTTADAIGKMFQIAAEIVDSGRPGAAYEIA